MELRKRDFLSLSLCAPQHRCCHFFGRDAFLRFSRGKVAVHNAHSDDDRRFLLHCDMQHCIFAFFFLVCIYCSKNNFIFACSAVIYSQFTHSIYFHILLVLKSASLYTLNLFVWQRLQPRIQKSNEFTKKYVYFAYGYIKNLIVNNKIYWTNIDQPIIIISIYFIFCCENRFSSANMPNVLLSPSVHLNYLFFLIILLLLLLHTYLLVPTTVFFRLKEDMISI